MQEDLKKEIFMLVDGSAIVHRAYHAMPPFTTKEGVPTGAVYGFFSMILKLIQELHPAHIAVAFDRPKPTFRQQMYAGYQAQRPKVEGDLSDQFGMIIEILKTAKIPVYAVDGYEADDIIGTISEKAKATGHLVYIITGDRDMLQLVNHKTKVLMPIKGISEVKIFDEDRVLEKYGVKPSQIIELKALTGDASDNYPGVAGIGPKTAANLINKYGTVEEVYRNLGEIGSKNQSLGQKLIDGIDAAQMAHTLATILTDVPFSYDFEDCSVKNLGVKELKEELEKYEFKTLPKRIDEIFGGSNDVRKTQMKLL